MPLAERCLRRASATAPAQDFTGDEDDGGELISRREDLMTDDFREQCGSAREHSRRGAPHDRTASSPRAAPDVDTPVDERVLAQVAHDLRTPLQAIRATLGRLEDPSLLADPSLTSDAVGIIDRSTKRMENLILELMETEAARTGRMVLRYGPVQVENLILEAIEEVRPLAAVKSISIVIEAPRRIAACCDEGKVLRVLTNLLGNAIKFTPRGGQVFVRSWQGELEVGIEVRDTGAGIGESELQSLFEPFRSGGGARSGLGLGLYIAKSVVMAHGGHIWIDSDIGMGTCVTFTLPTQPPA
jgi:signal transduction histidine kinase